MSTWTTAEDVKTDFTKWRCQVTVRSGSPSDGDGSQGHLRMEFTFCFPLSHLKMERTNRSTSCVLRVSSVSSHLIPNNPVSFKFLWFPLYILGNWCTERLKYKPLSFRSPGETRGLTLAHPLYSPPCPHTVRARCQDGHLQTNRERPQELPCQPWSWTPSFQNCDKYISVFKPLVFGMCSGGPSKLSRASLLPQLCDGKQVFTPNTENVRGSLLTYRMWNFCPEEIHDTSVAPLPTKLPFPFT